MFAEAILHQKIGRAGLMKQFTCSSAGTDALTQAPPPKDIQVFMRKHGYDISGKISHMVTKQMIESADIVFGLDRTVHDYLQKKYKLQKGKIFLLRQFDLPDPTNDPDIRDISENHDAADILETYGNVKREINRIFEKLSLISNKKVAMAKEYNKRKLEA